MSDLDYVDPGDYVCPECAHEWPLHAAPSAVEVLKQVRDANGTVLSDGDTVTLIKDLKLKGSSSTMKVGTKIKSIRIVEGDHELDCKSDFGSIMLKACFVKKA